MHLPKVLEITSGKNFFANLSAGLQLQQRIDWQVYTVLVYSPCKSKSSTRKFKKQKYIISSFRSRYIGEIQIYAQFKFQSCRFERWPKRQL